MMIVVYLAMMVAYSPALTAVAMVFIPCYVVLALAMTPLMKRQFRQVFEKMSASESTMVEAVSGFETVISRVPNTSRRAPISVRSPRGIPVPCASISPRPSGSRPASS